MRYLIGFGFSVFCCSRKNNKLLLIVMLEITFCIKRACGVSMTRKKPTVGIIGLGPVGSILAAHLIRSGENVIVEDAMPNILLKIKKDGLNVSGIVQLAVKADKVASSLAELAQFQPDIVFIVIKACYLRPLLPELKQVYTPKMKIVSFQNGLGNEQFIAENLGIDTVYRVVINYAGNLLGPGNAVMNWFQPPNYVGVLHKGMYKTDETTKQIEDILTAAGLKTEESKGIMRHIWEKNILNSALCSICAVTGQTMAEAMQYVHSRNLALKLLEEGLNVAKADGYDFGSDALTKFTAYLEKGGAHKPSMLIDVENKRPTEVDFMSGAIGRYGEKYKFPTPVNSVFTALLKTIESRYLKS
jgi:2-dehydropantoate 2-reductase